MTRVLAYGEGGHEVGSKAWSAAKADYTVTEGWLQPLIRKIANACEVRGESWKTLTAFPGKKARSMSGLSQKAALAKSKAGVDGFAVVVFMADADTNESSERDEVVQQIEVGFSAVLNGVAAVCCVPMSTSESWLLADENAWRQVGLDKSARFPQKSPESLWGTRNKPYEDHPKHVFASVCVDAEVEDSIATRCVLAENSNVETLRSRCPVSFPPFADALSNAAP